MWHEHLDLIRVSKHRIELNSDKFHPVNSDTHQDRLTDQKLEKTQV